MIIFYSLRFETSSNLEGQVPVFICPRNRLAQFYPQALGSLFVDSCGSQDIKIQFIPHREHITSQLQSPTG
jgi:hypothetical protein